MKQQTDKLKLSVERLKTTISHNDFPFATTDKLKPYYGILGQDRAVTALQFGVAMQQSGYHMYVMGRPGSGRNSYVKAFLDKEAKRQTTPHDYLYVNNYRLTREPFVLALPAGMANIFRDDFEQLLDNLLATFPAAFEHPSYQQQKARVEQEFNQQYDRAIDTVEKAALKHSIALFKDTNTISFTPVKGGKMMDEAEFASLPDDEREAFHQHISHLEILLNEALVGLPQWKRESSDKMRKLNRQTINRAIAPLFRPLHDKYKGMAKIQDFLQATKEQLHKTVIELLVEESEEAREDAEKKEALTSEFAPNLVVARDKTAGAPVIHESHPSYRNLFGRVEYSSDLGTLVTNFRHICPGSLHQANGGYLIIDADKLLTEPHVWDALKRALKEEEIRLESLVSELGLVNTISLNPQPIPLKVKIVLIGDRETYHLLQAYDSDFHKLFKVTVDFDDEILLNEETKDGFARLMQTYVEKNLFKPLTSAAVARLIEHSLRLAENKSKLSASFRDMFDLVSEANCLRRMARDKLIEVEHIERALHGQEWRTNRLSSEIMDDMLDNTILIDTQGEYVGKINGLTVLDLGNNCIGTPSRISATVFPGTAGIVDIEREAELGQAIHSKGVMILSGYLGQKYAQDFPLNLTANIALEQSYGKVDGDSASLAELCCLISAITQIPLSQSLALTGSINQYGEVQAVGGINEKIEGFFKLCEKRGLTGNQGVIIPAANVKNLMLNQPVVEAVTADKFAIYAINKVDQALELLTHRPVGELDENHQYPTNSINGIAITKLKKLAELANNHHH
ncbi:AAA family ATPase [Endozoicomonas sp. SM1973]|uniref:endopeptidase La n=1 Tax=Spartinivicinus marinus TaxID=2994442 RepID=A0A853IGN5_9GAMM|nr:ATP-binding protein [Spartinivicinus marinus]MCX4025673.1 AAA family ATPase [Spartinivicinus marinus]NYZ68305.1 AAA family ATPase [Spartinivicinus marinus]